MVDYGTKQHWEDMRRHQEAKYYADAMERSRNTPRTGTPNRKKAIRQCAGFLIFVTAIVAGLIIWIVTSN